MTRYKRPTARASRAPLFNDGTFGTKQLAVGTATFAFGSFVSTVVPTIFASYRASLALVTSKTGASAGAAEAGTAQKAPEVRDFSDHGAAGAARWVQLADGLLGPTDARVLLEHDPKDDLCPCPLARCAGPLVARAGALRVFEALFKTSLILLVMLAGSWTALVSPGIAARTWTTPWSAVFAAIYVLTMLTVSPPVMLLRFSTNVLLLQLSQRVDRRAMKAALRAVLEHHRASTDPDAPAPPASPGRAAYMDLHASFSAVWRRRVLQSNVSAPVIFATLVHLLMLVVNAAACSCLPAAYIIYIGYIGMMNLIDLVNVAAANAQVSDVRSLYLDTVREIREMQRESPPSSSAGARWAMDRDAAVLSSYVASDMHRARLFGLVVTYGVVRTVLVTVLTLLVALWSVMRGLGLVLTMETIWPTV